MTARPVLTRDYGVRYLLVDHVHGGRKRAVARRVGFANGAVTIRAVAP